MAGTMKWRQIMMLSLCLLGWVIKGVCHADAKRVTPSQVQAKRPTPSWSSTEPSDLNTPKLSLFYFITSNYICLFCTNLLLPIPS